MKLSIFLYFAKFGIKTALLKKKDPILGTVILTDKCNLHCKHCSVNNITAKIHSYEQIRSEMQQLYDMGVRILFFCGGETFLWEDGDMTLRDLVIKAKEMGFLIVNVVTNGTFPIDLPEADLILLSLDGDRDRHNAIRGNTYDIIMENIKNATSDNICFYMAINGINNSFPTPCHQCVVIENGKISTCGRCIDIPGLCDECGYFFVAEYTLLFSGKLKIIYEMFKTYLKYI